MWKSLKRWPVVLAVLIAALAVGLVPLPRGSRVTRENCERIQVGMTMDEVQAILGEPWNDRLLDPEGPSVWDRLRVTAWLRVDRHCCYWMGRDVGIAVIFDDNGRARRTDLCTDPDRPRSSLPGRVWRRLRDRLGW
jgi:outer membrane protein assembly factor BamE (lipoprotein component of BamABCDE complex)